MPPCRNTPPGVPAGARPFAAAEEAWFCTMAALHARHAGSAPVLAAGTVVRLCEPDDVLQVLQRLYRNRRITLEHGRVLRRYGERGVPPDPRRHARDWRVWSEAMERLGGLLRQRGLITAGLPASSIVSPVPDCLSAEARLLAQLQAL